jgi:hypothetical protein
MAKVYLTQAYTISRVYLNLKSSRARIIDAAKFEQFFSLLTTLYCFLFSFLILFIQVYKVVQLYGER